MKNLYLFLLFGLFTLKVSSQIPGLSYYTSTLSAPYYDNTQYAEQISQAPNGDIWINVGSNNAIVKFSNGVFSGPFVQSGNSLRTALCAVNNGVWCKRKFNGFDSISFFNGTTWTDYTSNFTTVKQKRISHIAQVGTEIWFATQEGIKVYDGSTWSLINRSSNGLPCDSITYIRPVNSNQVLIGTWKGLVSKIGVNYTIYNFPPPSPSQTSVVFSIFTNGTRHFLTREDWSAQLTLYEFDGSAIVNASPITKGAEIQTGGNICSLLFTNNGILLPFQSSIQFSENGFYNCFFNNNKEKNYLFPVPKIDYFFPSLSTNKIWFVTYDAVGLKIGELDLNTFNNLPINTITFEEYRTLDINNVKAGIYTTNVKHYDAIQSGASQYEVPKGGGVSSSYATSIWIGGLDNNNQLHVAANTYRQYNATDFWPGPLDANSASTNTTTAAKFKKLWKLDCNDINNFTSGCLASSNTIIPQDLKDYPANDVSLPYNDSNGDNFYNVDDCDYPIIKGDQQILSVYNDNMYAHSETKGLPMGLEIIERSYAYNDPNIADSMKAINYTTFYHYTITNRSNTNYHDVYISDWSDADLGCYLDDYVGSDSANQFAYIYNATNIDALSCSGVPSYGKHPPVSSHVLLNTNCSTDGIDNNHDGFIDEAGEQFLMDVATYYSKNYSGGPFSCLACPQTKWQYYNYMTGRHKDSTFFTYGGNAYGGSSPTKYFYTGNPETNVGWTEKTANNLSGDRQILMSSGPFNFPSKRTIEWEFAIVYSRDTTVANTIQKFNSVVRKDVSNVRHYHKTHQKPQCAPYIAKAIDKPFIVSIYPNPGSNEITVNVTKTVSKLTVEVFDVTGRIIRSLFATETYLTSFSAVDLSAGIYLIRISDGESKVTEKWIKQ